MHRYFLSRSKRLKHSHANSTAIVEEAAILKHGFLSKNALILPSYENVEQKNLELENLERKNLERKDLGEETGNIFGQDNTQGRSLTGYGTTLTVIDMIHTIENNYRKSRLLLFEAARLSRPSFTVIRYNRIKLSDGPRAFDRAIYEAIRDLEAEGTIYLPPGFWEAEAHVRAMANPVFKDALAKGTRTLRRLEKKLRDAVIDELTAGIIDKKDVNHTQLLSQLNKIHTEVRDVCADVMREYHSARARPDVTLH